MRRPIAATVILIAATLSWAQDGLYGSFIVGQKFINMDELNTSLATSGIGVEFPSNHWTFGGEGHIIVARHFVVGGKGMLAFNEQSIEPDPTIGDRKRFLKVTGGMGVASLGYAFIGAEDRLHLYPQVGAGVTTFLFQSKRTLNEIDDNSFAMLAGTENDQMVLLQKVGLAVDLCLGFDWFMKLIELKALIPGLTFGPMLHAQAGYTIVPGELPWMRDTDQLRDGTGTLNHYPVMKFQGLYFAVGVGIGLTSAKDD